LVIAIHNDSATGRTTKKTSPRKLGNRKPTAAGNLFLLTQPHLLFLGPARLSGMTRSAHPFIRLYYSVAGVQLRAKAQRGQP
jgi:hypothetical protein